MQIRQLVPAFVIILALVAAICDARPQLGYGPGYGPGSQGRFPGQSLYGLGRGPRGFGRNGGLLGGLGGLAVALEDTIVLDGLEVLEDAVAMEESALLQDSVAL
ncbi:hypothetical protein Aduo_007524 [Ancylostoma duodenale]